MLRVLICRELQDLCDRLSFAVRCQSASVLRVLEETQPPHCPFLSADCIKRKTPLSTPLSGEENEALSAFLYALGKSDAASQLKMIEEYDEYLKSCEQRHQLRFDKNAKLYITFGAFAGMTAALLAL